MIYSIMLAGIYNTIMLTDSNAPGTNRKACCTPVFLWCSQICPISGDSSGALTMCSEAECQG